MGVNNAVAETLDQLRVNNAHEASEHNVIGGGREAIFSSSARFQEGAVGVVAGLHQEGGYTRRLGTFNAQTGLVGTPAAMSREARPLLQRRGWTEDSFRIRIP